MSTGTVELSSLIPTDTERDAVADLLRGVADGEETSTVQTTSTTYSATVRLVTPVEVSVLPASAVIADEDGQLCVLVSEGLVPSLSNTTLLGVAEAETSRTEIGVVYSDVSLVDQIVVLRPEAVVGAIDSCA